MKEADKGKQTAEQEATGKPQRGRKQNREETPEEDEKDAQEAQEAKKSLGRSDRR